MEIKYIRVSSVGQNEERQIDNKTTSIIDKCSGTILFKNRENAPKIFEMAHNGQISALRVQSIDRLGRDTIDIMQTIKELTSLGVNVISDKEGLSTLIDGKENPVSKLIINILATLSEFELNRIKERQREGIAIAKAKGAYKGNGGKPKESIDQFLSKKKNAKCYRLLNQERPYSIREAASISGVSPSTAQKIKKIIDAER